MEEIENDADRRLSIEMAIECDLPLDELRLRVVRRVLSDASCEDDDKKINVLDWLLLDPQLPEDALVEINALVRFFVAAKKVEEASLAIRKAVAVVAHCDKSRVSTADVIV